MKSNKGMKELFDVLILSAEEEYLAWVLACLTPWSSLPIYDETTKATKGAAPRGTLAVREGIKAPTRVCELVTGAFEHYKAITALKDAVLRDQPWIYDRDTVGMSIRSWDAKGRHWRLQVMFALLVESLLIQSGGKSSPSLSTRAIHLLIDNSFRLYIPCYRLAEMPCSSGDDRRYAGSRCQTSVRW